MDCREVTIESQWILRFPAGRSKERLVHGNDVREYSEIDVDSWKARGAVDRRASCTFHSYLSLLLLKCS